MQAFTTVPRKKFTPSKKQTKQLKREELAGRITSANLHDNLKWLRNERNKFEKEIEVKHDFLVTQAHRQLDHSQQDLIQQHCQHLSQLDAELRALYNDLEKVNVAVHTLQLLITGKVP
jgi:hypothetical protein